jgi:hypothetical protein
MSAPSAVERPANKVKKNAGNISASVNVCISLLHDYFKFESSYTTLVRRMV